MTVSISRTQGLEACSGLGSPLIRMHNVSTWFGVFLTFLSPLELFRRCWPTSE